MNWSCPANVPGPEECMSPEAPSPRAGSYGIRAYYPPPTSLPGPFPWGSPETHWDTREPSARSTGAALEPGLSTLRAWAQSGLTRHPLFQRPSSLQRDTSPWTPRRGQPGGQTVRVMRMQWTPRAGPEGGLPGHSLALARRRDTSTWHRWGMWLRGVHTEAAPSGVHACAVGGPHMCTVCARVLTCWSV